MYDFIDDRSFVQKVYIMFFLVLFLGFVKRGFGFYDLEVYFCFFQGESLRGMSLYGVRIFFIQDMFLVFRFRIFWLDGFDFIYRVCLSLFLNFFCLGQIMLLVWKRQT